MNTETIITTILTASKGKMLTNGTAHARVVVLGAADSPENWHEITMEEYNAIIEKEI